MSSLQDLINDLKDWLEEADNIVDNAPDPLTESEQQDVAAKLDQSEGNIDHILDPGENPSLSPPIAGSVDDSINPVSLRQFSQATFDLAEQAQLEARQPTPDDDIIGSRIKTIKHLLPGYRAAAGIE